MESASRAELRMTEQVHDALRRGLAEEPPEGFCGDSGTTCATRERVQHRRTTRDSRPRLRTATSGVRHRRARLRLRYGAIGNPQAAHRSDATAVRLLHR